MRSDCVYLDSETCGFAGMAVLLQYAWGQGEIELFEPWMRPASETLDLIERVMDHTLVGFNLAFDHFHLCKLYTAWRLLPPDAIPANLPVMQVAEAERDGRDGPCLKPKGAMDLMLHSRKGEHQSLMSRHDVRISKIPIQLADRVCASLDSRIKFDPILKAYWTTLERKNRKGEVSTEFRDVALKFKPDRGLKSLAKHCLGLDPEFHSFREVWPERESKYAELKYAPYALTCPDWEVRDNKGKLKGHCWPHHIAGDIKHWHENSEARRYARDDVIYTRLLDEYFGYPGSDDDDSILSCMVAAVRWHGFSIDEAETARLLEKSKETLAKAPININKPTEVRSYIKEVMDPTESILLDKSTKKANLERIKDRFVIIEEEECISCFGGGCPRCKGNGVLEIGTMACAERAAEILDLKAAAKERDQHAKLIRAGRFHASFKVIGTLSSRMAGGDGLNAQGIKKSKEVRQAFPLKWDGMILCGGDFDSFEVTIAEAVFRDPQMRKDLINGLSIHTVMAKQLYPDKTYEEIVASKAFGDGGDIDMYTRGKQAVFTVVYGGNEGTIARKLAIREKVAMAAFDGFQERYPGVRESREKNNARFSSMQQPGGRGTEVIWHTPDEYCETFLGFRRYFTLENWICKELYDMANNIPKEWQLGEKINGQFESFTCNRRDKQQTLHGASSSALYGAAFNLQGANTRAANNHYIQSPGAQMTKSLQCAIWALQPQGVHGWRVAPMNIHDEVMVVTRPDLAEELTEIVTKSVEGFREKVPLIGLKWVTDMSSWGEKIPDDDPRVTHIQHNVTLDDTQDPEADVPMIDEPYEEWEESDDA